MKVLVQKAGIIISSTIIIIQNIILKSVKILLFRRNRALLKEPRTILVFRSSGIGDFVCAMPALHQLNEHFRKSKIVLLTIPSANPHWKDKITPAGMFLADHLVDEKWLIPADKLKDLTVLKQIRRKIRNLNPDICFILPFSGEGFIRKLKKMLYLYFLGLRRNLFGVHIKSTMSFFPRSQFVAGKFCHQVEAAIEPLREMGIKETKIAFNIRIPAVDKEYIEQLWKKHNLKDKIIIALHPGSNYLVKQWPAEKFADFGSRLFAINSQIRIVIVGGRDDKSVAESLQQKWQQRAVNWAGSCSLLRTAEILRKSHLFVGNDSGPMHLAVAVKTPVVAIFSSFNFPVFWRPWGKSNTLIRHSTACEFCFTKDGKCPRNTYECIRSISVEEVIEASLPYLESIVKK